MNTFLVRRATPLLVLLGLPVFGGACLLEKPGTRLPMTAAAETAFAQECSQVRSIGDVAQLSARVDQETRKILGLAGAPNPTTNEPAIRSLVADITSAVTSLEGLTAPEWNTEKWSTEQTWDFGPNDLMLIDSGCDLREKEFTSAEITQVFWNGTAHPELISRVYSEVRAHSAHFELDLSQSTLSLCELMNVTGVQVRLNFTTCGQADYRDYALSLGNPEE